MPSTFLLKLQNYFWVLKVKLYSTLVRKNFLEKNVWKSSTCGLIFPLPFDLFSIAETSRVTIDSSQPTQKSSESKTLRTVGWSHCYSQPSPGLPVGPPHSSVKQSPFSPCRVHWIHFAATSTRQAASPAFTAHPQPNMTQVAPTHMELQQEANTARAPWSGHIMYVASVFIKECLSSGGHETALEIEFPIMKSVLVAILINLMAQEILCSPMYKKPHWQFSKLATKPQPSRRDFQKPSCKTL